MQDSSVLRDPCHEWPQLPVKSAGVKGDQSLVTDSLEGVTLKVSEFQVPQKQISHEEFRLRYLTYY